MAFRTVVISNPAELHARKEQLEIHQEEVTQVPLDEIILLFLESPDITFSSAFLSKVTDYGIVIISCDRKYKPAAISLSYLPHSRQTKMARTQFAMTKPFQKRLWQAIIKSKIANQADVLDFFSKEGAEVLRSYGKEVSSGDSRNREALAARYYFPRLFEGHVRDEDNVINDALNYAYSIVRALVSRSIVAYGFYPPLGIHHCNEMNNFNLADDLIEPFRPIIDAYVRAHPPKGKELNREDRHRYVQTAHLICRFAGKRMTVASSIDRMTSSLVEAINKSDYSKLSMPQLDGVEVSEDVS